MKNKIILLLLSLSISLSNTTGGGLAFLNVPGTAKMNSLGNTMFSDFSNPSSILVNPANTWHQSSYKFSINNVVYNPQLDIQLSHLFLSFKPKNKFKKSSFTFGFIQHGIDNIESYTDNAEFDGYFTFSDLAFLMGYSYKTTNINWGFSAAVISENFSNIDYETAYFYQYDIGMSMIKIPISSSNIDFSFGVNLKNTVDSKFKNQNSANNNNIIGTMLSYSSFNSPIRINSYFDFLFQKSMDIYTGRFGVELSYDFNVKTIQDKLGKVKYKPYGVSLCIGYNDFRFTSLDVFDLQETNEYNSQLKYGIGVTLPLLGYKVDIFGGQTFDGNSNPLKSKFMSIYFSKNRNY